MAFHRLLPSFFRCLSGKARRLRRPFRCFEGAALPALRVVTHALVLRREWGKLAFGVLQACLLPHSRPGERYIKELTGRACYAASRLSGCELWDEIPR